VLPVCCSVVYCSAVYCSVLQHSVLVAIAAAVQEFFKVSAYMCESISTYLFVFVSYLFVFVSHLYTSASRSLVSHVS